MPLLTGGLPDDTVVGGDGGDDMDTVTGGQDDEPPSATTGPDTFTGGNDTLKGNGGADVFQVRASDRNDTIFEFRQGRTALKFSILSRMAAIY